jgi:hypothetical protein
VPVCTIRRAGTDARHHFVPPGSCRPAGTRCTSQGLKSLDSSFEPTYIRYVEEMTVWPDGLLEVRLIERLTNAVHLLLESGVKPVRGPVWGSRNKETVT